MSRCIQIASASALITMTALVGCVTATTEEGGVPTDDSSFWADGKADGAMTDDSRALIPATEAHPRLAALAESVALVVDRIVVGPSDTHGDVLLLAGTPTCDGHSLSGRPRVPDGCTAFLVAPDVVVSSCLDAALCNNNAFVFGPQPSASDPNQLSAYEGDVYLCKEVIHHEWDMSPNHWSMVRLDRPVAGRPPLPLDFNFAAVQPNQELIVAGYPGETSATIERRVRISDYSDFENSFTAPIFATAGGSPVFHAGTGRVLGIILGSTESLRSKVYVGVGGAGQAECLYTTACTRSIDCMQTKVMHLTWMQEAFESTVGVMMPTSCIGHCGRNAGECSCEPSCIETGTCCDDYGSFCLVP